MKTLLRYCLRINRIIVLYTYFHYSNFSACIFILILIIFCVLVQSILSHFRCGVANLINAHTHVGSKFWHFDNFNSLAYSLRSYECTNEFLLFLGQSLILSCDRPYIVLFSFLAMWFLTPYFFS